MNNKKYEKRKKANRIIFMILGIIFVFTGVVLILEGGDAFISGAVFLILGLILITASIKAKDAENPEIVAKRRVKEKFPNVNIDKFIDLGLIKDKISIDNEKKFFIIEIIQGKHIGYKKIDFNKLIDFELIQDDDTIVKSNALKTVAGGVVFGVVGALVGATSNKKKKEYCSSMKLKLNIDDLDNSIIYINIIQSKTKFNTEKYLKLKNKAEELLGVLKYIKNKNNIPEEIND